MNSKNTPNILKIDTVGPTGSHYGPPWARWVSTEVDWERTGCPLKPRWDPLGPTMVHSHWVPPWSIKGPLGPTMGPLRVTRVPLGPTMGPLGATGDPLGPTMVHQGPVGGPLGSRVVPLLSTMVPAIPQTCFSQRV